MSKQTVTKQNAQSKAARTARVPAFGERILAQGVSVQSASRKNNNDLVIGLSGAGKTRGYVKPNLLQMTGSYVVTDPKGALVREVGPVLAARGYQVLSIDFSDLAGWEEASRVPFAGCTAVGYNPLDYVRTREGGAYNEQDVQYIAQALCPERSHDPFWDKAAAQYLTALIAYQFEAIVPEQRSLSFAAELACKVGTDALSALFCKIDPRCFARASYERIRSSVQADKMVASIVGILQEHLKACEGAGARQLFSASRRVDFRALAQRPCALFLKVSDTDRSQDQLVALFYAQALKALCDYADHSEGGRLPFPVRLILDDFATNCVIADFDKVSSNIRSRDIAVSVILQSLTQLEALYGVAAASTIMSNCEHWLYLGGQDLKTAELMSRRMEVPVDEVFALDREKAVVLALGRRAQTAPKYDLCTHPLWGLTPEAAERPYVANGAKEAGDDRVYAA